MVTDLLYIAQTLHASAVRWPEDTLGPPPVALYTLFWADAGGGTDGTGEQPEAEAAPRLCHLLTPALYALTWHQLRNAAVRNPDGTPARGRIAAAAARWDVIDRWAAAQGWPASPPQLAPEERRRVEEGLRRAEAELRAAGGGVVSVVSVVAA